MFQYVFGKTPAHEGIEGKEKHRHDAASLVETLYHLGGESLFFHRGRRDLPRLDLVPEEDRRRQRRHKVTDVKDEFGVAFFVTLGSEKHPVDKHDISKNEGYRRSKAMDDSVKRFEKAFVYESEVFVVVVVVVLGAF